MTKETGALWAYWDPLFNPLLGFVGSAEQVLVYDYSSDPFIVCTCRERSVLPVFGLEGPLAGSA